MTDPDDQPRFAFLGHLAFAIVLAIVIARCLMVETIRDPSTVATAMAAPPGPGAATSIVLDWLSVVPALLVLGRRLLNPSRRLTFNAAHACLFSLAAWTAASVFWADDRFLVLVSASRIVGGAALFWAASQLIVRWDQLRVIVGVVIGLLLVNVVQGALYQNVELADLKTYYFANKDQILADHGWRAMDYTAQRFEMKLLAGEMINFSVSANVLGALAVTAALAALGAAMQRLEDRDDRGWAGALFLAALGSVYILAHTGSKASWAALALGIALMAVWRWRQGPMPAQVRSSDKGREFEIVTPAAAEVAASDAFQSASVSSINPRAVSFRGYLATLVAIVLGVAAVVTLGLVRHGLPSDSLNFRWRYWVGSWPLVLERPLTGVGWGNFADAYLRHRLPTASEEIQDPHSFPVKWLVELGAVGLLLGLGWLIAWGWSIATFLSPSPGTPGEGQGEGLRTAPDDRSALTRGTGRGDESGASDASRTKISRVLIALLLALATTIACTIDFGGDSNYATLEIARRAMYLGLIALSVGLVCLPRRESPSEPFYVDDRPAPWLCVGLLVGVLMMLLQSTIDIALFQPGPWVLMAVAMGGLMGLNGRTTVSAAESVPTERHGVTPSKGSMAVALSTAAVSLAWIAAAVIVGRVVLAEWNAGEGDSLVSRKSPNASSRFAAATSASPVSNFDYANRAAMAAMQDGGSASARPALDQAIAASPHHAMNWLTRARYLTSQRDVSPADAQQAIDDFGHAVALNPNDVDLHIEFADLLERFGHHTEAADQLDTALKADDGLDRAEPKRLALRSPGRYEAIQKRAAQLRATMSN